LTVEDVTFVIDGGGVEGVTLKEAVEALEVPAPFVAVEENL
jgi:hypothetical protein